MTMSHVLKAVLMVAACLGFVALAPERTAPAAPVPKQEPDPVKLDLARLQGTWQMVGGEHRGEKLDPNELKKYQTTWEFKGEEITFRSTANKDGFQVPFKIDPTKQPKAINLGPIYVNGKLQEHTKGNDSPGIYDLKGDTLRVCYGSGGNDGKQRPKEFKTTPWNPADPREPYERLLVFERVKPKEAGK
jgi:uncharacterized protein (TIGR03067 family)